MHCHDAKQCPKADENISAAQPLSTNQNCPQLSSCQLEGSAGGSTRLTAGFIKGGGLTVGLINAGGLLC